jgi:hypothetical protein
VSAQEKTDGNKNKTSNALVTTTHVRGPNFHRSHQTGSVVKGHATPELSRKKLKDPDTWPKWRSQECGHLTMFDMLGPQPLNRDAVMLPWAWTHLHKIDQKSLEEVKKSRGTCKQHGRSVTLAKTHAACVEHPAQ